jgi:glycosyltransferase involved in cell wall biosynthesis
MSAPTPVSVIIPVRDAAAHLAAAIESVLDQDPPPREVIVIDGGSVDGSGSIGAAYAGVRVLEQSTRGLSAARNEAIQASRTPLIAFCDADDRWTPGSLATRLEAIEQDAESLAVIGHLVLEPLEGTAMSAAQRARVGVPLPGFTPGALLVRRRAFEIMGWFDETLTIGGDSDWFVRLQQSPHPATVIEDVVLRKGARDSSLSADMATYRRELLGIARRFIGEERERMGKS